MNVPSDPGASGSTTGWRYWVGLSMLVVSLIMPVLAAVLVPLFGFPKDVNAALFALSLAGVPDVLMFASAAVMGKENMDRILGRIGSWAKRLLRWDTVTRRRYVVGLWVLTISFFVPFVIGLFFEDEIATADGGVGWAYYVIIGSSIAFLGSFLSMGARLWERVRAIFVWDAHIVFPDGE